VAITDDGGGPDAVEGVVVDAPTIDRLHPADLGSARLREPSHGVE
jgi:hypothetical protein